MAQTFSIIAIDGGAASGKSSTARAVAEKLHMLYVETGAHYRTLTAYLLEQGATPEKTGDLPYLLAGIRLDTVVTGNDARLALNGNIVDKRELRSDKVNAAVSPFATLPEVRSAVLLYQRDQARIARHHGFNGVVMEGRDIGTVIFPNAEFKFFLEADAETREARRSKQDQDIDESIEVRDARDAGRADAPMKVHDDAVRIDTGKLNLEAVVAKIVETVEAAEG